MSSKSLRTSNDTSAVTLPLSAAFPFDTTKLNKSVVLMSLIASDTALKMTAAVTFSLLAAFTPRVTVVVTKVEVVGSGVGCREGSGEGCQVEGKGDGAPEGPEVGFMVGPWVGSGVGVFVGWLVGLGLGAGTGSREGAGVGTTVGKCVGSGVGTCDG